MPDFSDPATVQRFMQYGLASALSLVVAVLAYALILARRIDELQVALENQSTQYKRSLEQLRREQLEATSELRSKVQRLDGTQGEVSELRARMANMQRPRKFLTVDGARRIRAKLNMASPAEQIFE